MDLRHQLLRNRYEIIEDLGGGGFGKVFKAMLGGNLNQLTKGFAITGEDKKATWQLQLTPKDELLKKIISSMVLSGDNDLRFVEIRETGGNMTRIKFAQITHPARLTPEQEADFERLSSQNNR